MLVERGNLWAYYDRGYAVVIPTNISVKRDGSNAMGAGTAAQAAARYPWLAQVYGHVCSEGLAETPVALFMIPHVAPERERELVPWYYSDPPGMLAEISQGAMDRLILFPVKPYNEQEPWMGWNWPAAEWLIERSCQQLVQNFPSLEKMALPLVGCGAGDLDPGVVLPILRRCLDDRFVLVLLPEPASANVARRYGRVRYDLDVPQRLSEEPW